MFNSLFIGDIEKYRRLRGLLKSKNSELIDYCNTQNELLKSKKIQLEEAEDALSKGNGFSAFHVDRLNDEIMQIGHDYFNETKRRDNERVELKKSIENMEKSDVDIRELSKYEMFFTRPAFEKYVIELGKIGQAGNFSKSDIISINSDLLKFKKMVIGGVEYKVKDNRKHFADMVLIDKDTGKIFLVKRSPQSDFEPNKWALPGGHVEPAENYLKAAIRGTKEETGLIIDPKDVVPCGVYEDSDVYISYFCTTIDVESLITLEGVELTNFTYVSLDELLNMNDLIMNLRDNFQYEKIKLPVAFITPNIVPVTPFTIQDQA